jgi:uncharacterized Tic20 family protein
MVIKRYETDSNDMLFGIMVWVTSFFAPLLGPLLILLIKKGDSRFVEDTVRMYFNIMLTTFILGVIAGILKIILVGFFYRIFSRNLVCHNCSNGNY